MIDSILQGFLHQDALDWSALLFGLAYVILIARGKWWGWILGIVSCALILWKDLFSYSLWADAGLQLFYIVMGFVGIRYWLRSSNKTIFYPKEWSLKKHFILILMGIILSLMLGYTLRGTPAALPFADSMTSVFAVLATGLMVLKLRSNWLYWVAIDGAYIIIYGRQEAYYFALLSFIYLLLAIYGFFTWKKQKAPLLSNDTAD